MELISNILDFISIFIYGIISIISFVKAHYYLKVRLFFYFCSIHFMLILVRNTIFVANGSVPFYWSIIFQISALCWSIISLIEGRKIVVTYYNEHIKKL